jgi:TonB family protein
VVVKWDSPFVLTLAGTIAIHTMLVVGADAVMVTTPKKEPEVPPRLELIDIKVAPKPKPKPPEPPKPQVKETPQEVKPVEPVKTPVKTAQRPVSQVRTTPPPPTTEQPRNASSDPGGTQTVVMDNMVAMEGNIDVIKGKSNKGQRTGSGLAGTGTGTGSGAGSGSAPPPPVSVATIKKRALPKGDYGYIDASRDYPAEARQRSIEGPIRVKLVVGEDGLVREATLLNRLGYGLDELALERAKKIQFDPARDTDDKAVTSIVIWTFNMTLPK